MYTFQLAQGGEYVFVYYAGEFVGFVTPAQGLGLAFSQPEYVARHSLLEGFWKAFDDWWSLPSSV